MSRNIPTLIAALVVIAIIAFMMFAYQVRFTETAVVTRLDTIRENTELSEPGLHFKLPWPIDRVHRFDTRLRSFETEFRQAATQDQKTIILTAFATWRIADGKKFLRAVGREDTADTKIRDLLANQVQLVLRTHPLDELVNTDVKKIKLDTIEQEFLHGLPDASAAAVASGEIGESSTEAAMMGIKKPALDKYGVEIVSVGIKRLGLPESVTKDVFTRMKEDRKKAIKQYQAEGMAEATKITVNADEISRKIVARAEAFAKTLEGQGDAEAAKYYKIFAENPKLSRFLKGLESLEEVFKSGQSTVVLDANKVFPWDLLKQKHDKPDGSTQSDVHLDSEEDQALAGGKPTDAKGEE
ncbi:MAG: protease modulator HflC [Phycisphaerae bacterium]